MNRFILSTIAALLLAACGEAEEAQARGEPISRYEPAEINCPWFKGYVPDDLAEQLMRDESRAYLLLIIRDVYGDAQCVVDLAMYLGDHEQLEVTRGENLEGNYQRGRAAFRAQLRQHTPTLIQDRQFYRRDDDGIMNTVIGANKMREPTHDELRKRLYRLPEGTTA